VLEVDAYAHLESAEPQTLMNAEGDLLHEVEEVEAQLLTRKRILASTSKDSGPPY
jgi:hypothetical protein